MAAQVVPVLLASLVPAVFLVLPAIMVTQDRQAPEVRQAKMGPQDLLVATVPRAAPGRRDPRAMPVNQVKRAHPVPKALPELQAHLESWEFQAHGVSLERRACRVPGEVPVHRVSRESLENQDLVVTTESVVLPGPRAFLVLLVRLENLAETETLDQMASQVEMDLLVARVIVGKMALLVLLVPLVTQAHLGLLVLLGRVETEEKLVLLALLAFQVLLVPAVPLVPKVHAVIKEKQVNVVLMASKDIEGSLVIQVLLVLRVPLAIKVLSAARDLQAPEDLLDLVGPLAKMEQVDIQAPLVHPDLVGTEEKEDLRAPLDTLDSLALPDLLGPLAHAVVVGFLPSLALVARKLVHIMEMSQQISRSTPKRS